MFNVLFNVGFLQKLMFALMPLSHCRNMWNIWLDRFINVFSLELWGYFCTIMFMFCSTKAFAKIDIALPALSLLKQVKDFTLHQKCFLCSLVRYSLLFCSCFVWSRFLQNWLSLAGSFSLLKHVKPFTYFRNALFDRLGDVFFYYHVHVFWTQVFCKFEVGPLALSHC